MPPRCILGLSWAENMKIITDEVVLRSDQWQKRFPPGPPRLVLWGKPWCLCLLPNYTLGRSWQRMGCTSTVGVVGLVSPTLQRRDPHGSKPSLCHVPSPRFALLPRSEVVSWAVDVSECRPGKAVLKYLKNWNICTAELRGVPAESNSRGYGHNQCEALVSSWCRSWKTWQNRQGCHQLQVLCFFSQS